MRLRIVAAAQHMGGHFRRARLSQKVAAVIMFYAPPKIPPLEYKGIRYQQDRESDFEGREAAATYLGATDIKTNDLLWAIKICDCIKCAPGSTAKFMDVDIAKISHGPAEYELTIETVVASRYIVDLQTRTVTAIPVLAPVKKKRKIQAADPSDPLMPPPWPRGGKSGKGR